MKTKMKTEKYRINVINSTIGINNITKRIFNNSSTTLQQLFNALSKRTSRPIFRIIFLSFFS